MKTTRYYFKYFFIIFLSCSFSNHAYGYFRSINDAISFFLFESTKRSTPTSHLIYLVKQEPDSKFERVNELVKYGGDPDALIEDTKETLLQGAIARGKVKIARALISSGATISWIRKDLIAGLFDGEL